MTTPKMSQTVTEIRLDVIDVSAKPPVLTTDVAPESAPSPAPAAAFPQLSLSRTIVIYITLTGITTASSMTTGLLAVALPAMAKDLHLSENLLLWPASVYGLTSGCSLLLAGSIADVVGSRTIYLIGCFLLVFFILASGLAKTGIQLIIFRGLQGIAVSFCLPTAVSILTEAFPNGQRRNTGFACIGAGQPLGYSLGLILGGVFVDTVGWRSGWYLSSAVALLVFGAGLWGLPQDSSRGNPGKPLWRKLADEIDWVGTLLASSSLGLLSYVLAIVSGSAARVRDTQNIVILSIVGVEIPLFIFWMRHQEKCGKPALIPNSLWKTKAFTAICVMVFLAWAVVQTIEYYFSLFFQLAQGLSAIQTSLRFLPNVLIGIVISIATGFLVHRLSTYYIVLCTSLLSAISPIIMALINPHWPYWYALFWAMLLSPFSADVLFIISALIITSSFPPTTQALAGAVFNTIAQFGTAVGLAVMAVISSSVTARSQYPDKSSPEALLEGYRVSFWACFAAILFACGVGGVGLRGVGKVGEKRE